MKKVFLSFFALSAMYVASAQISVGLNTNYTMYKQEFQKNTPGVGIRVLYEVSEKQSAGLSFTYGMPIKYASSTTIIHSSTGNLENVPSEIKYNFKTINLMGNFTFIGNSETTGKFYGSFGAGLVLVSYKEAITGNYDKTIYEAPEPFKGSENGFTINLGIGGEYKLGTPSIFGEAGIAFPANKVGDSYVQNYIPTHLTMNLGIRLPLGGSDF